MNILDKAIVKEVSLGVPVELAWQKWTSCEGLKSFMGYDNRLELKPNGAFEMYFLKEMPEGQRGGEGNKILSYLPSKMLSFTWNAPPNFPEVRNHKHKTWVVINFEKKGDTTCKLTLNHIGWLEGEQWDEVFNYFDNAWERVFESLSTSLA